MPTPTKSYEAGDPIPYGEVYDRNRGHHRPVQSKGKVWQSPWEIYNNPGKSNHGAIYDSGTDEEGIPYNYNGPYHY